MSSWGLLLLLLLMSVAPTAKGHRLLHNSSTPGRPSNAPDALKNWHFSSARGEASAGDRVLQEGAIQAAVHEQHMPAKALLSDLQPWLQDSSSWSSSDSITNAYHESSFSDRRRNLHSHVSYMAAQPAQQMSSAAGASAASLCSATINYGASVGDATKKSTADVPIFVGSFDVVVMQPPVPKVSFRS